LDAGRESVVQPMAGVAPEETAAAGRTATGAAVHLCCVTLLPDCGGSLHSVPSHSVTHSKRFGRRMEEGRGF
jgi:hypothetical protein